MPDLPIAVDLFCGLGGWAEGLLAEGWDVIGYDIEAHQYGDQKYPAKLVIQDVLTIHGSQFKDAALIVASPPCQEYSYMAMPWSKAKALEADYKSGKRDRKKLTALFDACFRIQREASEAAGHHIPMIVENVRGAQKWVGRARWNFGSYYLWGDVPALMPITQPRRKSKTGSWDQTRENYQANHSLDGVKAGDRNKAASDGGHQWTASWEATKHGPSPGKVWSDRPPSVSAHREKTGFKSQGMNWSDQTKRGQDFTRLAAQHCGLKLRDQNGGERDHPNAFGWKEPDTSSKSSARKAASATIAKIPFPLARWIAKTMKPRAALDGTL